MTPICRILSWFLFIGGVCVFVFGGYFYFAPPRPESLGVAESDIQLKDSFAGEKRDIVLRIDNNSGRPVRVVGVEAC